MENDSKFRLVDRPCCIVWLDRPIETLPAVGFSGAEKHKVDFLINLRTSFIRVPAKQPRRVAGVQTKLKVPAEGLDCDSVASILSIGQVPIGLTRTYLGFVVAKILKKARRAAMEVGRFYDDDDDRSFVIPFNVFVILLVDRIPRDLCKEEDNSNSNSNSKGFIES